MAKVKQETVDEICIRLRLQNRNRDCSTKKEIIQKKKIKANNGGTFVNNTEWLQHWHSTGTVQLLQNLLS